MSYVVLYGTIRIIRFYLTERTEREAAENWKSPSCHEWQRQVLLGWQWTSWVQGTGQSGWGAPAHRNPSWCWPPPRSWTGHHTQTQKNTLESWEMRWQQSSSSKVLNDGDLGERGAPSPDGAVVADDGRGGEMAALYLAHQELVHERLPRRRHPCLASRLPSSDLALLAKDGERDRVRAPQNKSCWSCSRVSSSTCTKRLA